MKSIYDYPQYCYLAYNWPRDYECNFIVDCLNFYLLPGRKKILDIACGPGVLAEMLSQHGCRVTGMDNNKNMVKFLRRKAGNIKPVCRDMADFRLRGKFDAAICMMDSFRYLLTPQAIIRHLRCVAAALSPAAIYIVDFWVPSKKNEQPNTKFLWENQGRDFRIKAGYKQLPYSFNRRNNIFQDQLVFKGEINGRRFCVGGRAEKTAYLPRRHFIELVKKSGVFDLADWFWDFSFSARINSRTKTNRLIAVLKKVESRE